MRGGLELEREGGAMDSDEGLDPHMPEQYWLGRIRVKSASITEALPPPLFFCLHFFGLPPGVKGSPPGVKGSKVEFR